MNTYTCRWSPAFLAHANLPKACKEFLVHVGLPCNQNWTLRFENTGDHPHRLADRPTYVCIGYDDTVPLCLDEARSGCVVSVDPYAPAGERYVNNGIESFAHFLRLYDAYTQSAGRLSEEKAQEMIDSMEREMKRIDPMAFSDAENWWAVMIEQMRQGLL